MLELTPGPGATVSQLDSVPVLTLRLHRSHTRRQIADAEYPSMLNAFAVLAQHSQRLSAFPELKREFWLDVLESSMPFEYTREILRTSFKNPAFPRFIVDLNRRERSPEQYEVLCEALYAFMTTPASTQTQRQQQAVSGAKDGVALPNPSMVAFGLSFAGNQLKSVSLEIIERFLDRVFAHPDRQFSLDMLDLSGNAMNAVELAIVARITRKSEGVYQLEELKLEKIIPGYVTNGWRCQDETPPEFLDIMRAAFDVDKLPALVNNKYRPTGLPSRQAGDAQPSHLRKISLKGNYLCPTYFAVLGSTLRYGCPLEEDVSRYVAKNHTGLLDKTDCWSWLAFALFYPRPKRFARAFKLRNIGHLECDLDAVKTFIRTLRNPATQLAYYASRDTSAADTLMVCTVKQGAVIQIFETKSVTRRAKWTETLLERSELEALCERADGSVCVVAPGVGLGWVKPEFVKCIEREPLKDCWSQLDGRYEVEVGGDGEHESLEGVRLLLTAIGRQIRTLSFDCYRVRKSLVPLILQHCVHLEHLDLESPSIPTSDLDALLNALRGDLGRRLKSLNLNDSVISDKFVKKIAAVLAAKNARSPVLRELRLDCSYFGAQTLASLDRALQVNCTLVLLQLATHSKDTNVEAERMRLEPT